MNIRQELLSVIEQLPDQQLSALLNMDLSLKGKNNSDEISQLNSLQVEYQAYQDWVSAENDICDEIFADAVTTESIFTLNKSMIREKAGFPLIRGN